MSSSRSHKSLEIGEEETRLSVPDDDDNDQSAPPVPSQSLWCRLKICLVILVVIFAIPLFVVVVAISIILIYIASFPVLILSFLVTRALQILWHGDDYNQAVQLKLFIRSSMFVVTSCLAPVLGILYGIAKLIPGFKRAVILETPLENWINLLFVIYGIYMLHWVLSICVFKFVPSIPLDRYQSGFNAPENVLEIIDCLIVLLALSHVEKRVPVFKTEKIHGLSTRKWTEVTIVVFLAYNVIVFLTRVFIASEIATKSLKLFGIRELPVPETGSQYNLIMLQKIIRLRYVKYTAVGVKHSIDFIFSSLVFLLTWEFYFWSHLEQTPQAQRVLEVGTISCVTLLVCAILWFIKTYLLLLWEVRAVYNRLENKIVKGARQLYFLWILAGSLEHNIFRNDDEGGSPQKNKNDEGGSPQKNKKDEGGFIKGYLNLFPVWDNQKQSAAMREIVCGDLLIKKGKRPTFYGLQQMAYYFLQAREKLKDDEWIINIKASRQQNSGNSGVTRITREELKKLEDDLWPPKQQQQQQEGDKRDYQEIWECFVEQMSEYFDSSPERPQEYPPEQIEKWMKMARNNCLFLANTLSSAKELVGCLNNIISWLVIAATFILWLLLTGYATTRVLVLFASPLVAASFIFGETCKTLFQGIIFVYVVHPFHVGDFCIIDEHMMEVRTIGIWITTFSKVDTEEEVIYPNSTLFTKNITNHKTNFDWNDHIELEVGSVNIRPKELKKKVEDFLYSKSDTCIDSLVMVSSRAENVTKIAVTYKCNKDMKINSTYSQCLKEKQMKKSSLLVELQDKVELDWKKELEITADVNQHISATA